MIIPGAVSFYNALIVRNYFMNSVPRELQEAAMEAAQAGSSSISDYLAYTQTMSMSLKYTTIIAGILPMMIAYPFV